MGLLVTMLVWGTQIPCLYLLLPRWDAFSLAALRYVLAAPLMLGILWLREGPTALPPRAHWGRLALLGAVGIGGLATLYTLGLAYSDPVTAIVIQSASPVVATSVAWGLFRVPLGPGMGVALALAVAGGLLVRLSETSAITPAGARGGEILLLLAGACWSWYSVACQRWLAGYSELRITALTFLSGGLALAGIYALAATAGLTRAPSPVPGPDVLLIAWVAIASTGVGVFFWHFGVSRLGLPMTALYLNVVPVVAVLLTLGVGVTPTPLQVLGGLLVLAGVAQAQLRRLGRVSGTARPPRDSP